jgi:hypothetical protein
VTGTPQKVYSAPALLNSYSANRNTVRVHEPLRILGS